MTKIKIIFIFFIIFFLSYLLIRNLWNQQNLNKKLPPPKEIYQAFLARSQSFHQNVCREGENAVLTSGPYIFLVNGDYKIEYFLRGEGVIFLDVVSSRAQKVLASQNVEIFGDNISREELFFTTSGGLDHEFRAFSQSKDEICLSGLKLDVLKRDWQSFIFTLPARLGRLIYFWIFHSNV
ncbi:hypothetical protein HYW31_02560 [Candidatus Berkelbacteria bacterium]|nr:hypothetical protein [Candidatus Berkelbacteria bacterium]